MGGRRPARERHVGYFLVDAGRRVLEARFGYRPPLGQRLRRFAFAHPALVYVGGIGIAIRYASTTATNEDEPREKISDGALGFLSLPFLLPLLKSVRTKAEDSADAIKEGVDRLKNVNVSRYTKPIRKRWKAWTK